MWRCLLFLSLSWCLASQVSAQTSYPMITHVTPVAVQRGTTTEVTVEGQMNFFGTYQALFEGTGIKAEVATKFPPRPAAGPTSVVKSVKLKLTVDAAAAPGVREFRVASPLGISSVGQIVVVEDPVVQEAGDNNTREKANPLPIPGVMCGRIEIAEDVDYFKFKAKAGQTMTFEVVCARIQDKIHDLQKHADPMLTLFDADGRELAANDDFYFADPLHQPTRSRKPASITSRCAIPSTTAIRAGSTRSWRPISPTPRTSSRWPATPARSSRLSRSAPRGSKRTRRL